VQNELSTTLRRLTAGSTEYGFATLDPGTGWRGIVVLTHPSSFPQGGEALNILVPAVGLIAVEKRESPASPGNQTPSAQSVSLYYTD
jgi:hypothetical protein